MQQRFNVRYCGFIAARCGCFVVVQTAYRVTLFDHFTLVQSIHLAIIMPLCGCLRVWWVQVTYLVASMHRVQTYNYMLYNIVLKSCVDSCLNCRARRNTWPPV